MRLAWAALLLLSGCGNPCQTLCDTLSDYAEECGRSISESERESCKDDFADIDRDQAQTCQDFGAPSVIRREWTCEDVNLYQDIAEAAADAS